MENEIIIKQISEREVWIGENRIYLGEDNIIYFTAVGEFDEKMAIATKEVMFKLVNMVEGRVNHLVDSNKAGKSSPEARKIFEELFKNEKFGKVAIFGLHPVAKALLSFFMGVSKKKDMRFFKTKEEVFAWLKE